MRYAKIYDLMWDNPEFISLSVQAKIGYVYICSCSHCNLIGYFRMPLAYMATDIGISENDAASVIAELEAHGLVLYNTDTNRVLIRSYLKWNPPQSGSNVKAMAKMFDELPADTLDKTFIDAADSAISAKRLIHISGQITRKICENSANTSVLNFKTSGGASGFATKDNTKGEVLPVVLKEKCVGKTTSTTGATKETETETETEAETEAEVNKCSSLRSLAPSCAENVAPSAPKPEKTTMDDSQDTLLVLPCTGGRSWTVTRGYLDGVRDAYPGVDLLGECRKAKVWLEANPTRRKTIRGMKAFLANWFTYAQDRQSHTGKLRGSSLPDSVVRTEDAWAGQKGGKVSFGGES